LPSDRIRTIPYPLGFTPMVERPSRVWADGSICFVGRLEPRKGIVEWVDAASRVAQEDPTVHFDFVGADAWELQSTLVAQLPRILRPRFRFHGSKTRAEIEPVLAGAKAAVVPSRWENFPNVCIEAMSSGLPVIVTRLGGMSELLEDERTGWLAPDMGVAGMADGLAVALRRCLAASPDQRASMGRAAAEAVREICDNERTVKAHIAFRADVARLGAQRSVTLAGLSRPDVKKPERGIALQSQCRGAGIVVRAETLVAAAFPLKSIRAQTTAHRAVVVVCARETANNLDIKARLDNPMDLFRPDCSGVVAWNVAFSAGKEAMDCGYWLFLDCDDYLLPDCFARLEHAFMHQSEIGIVAIWTERTAKSQSLEAPLCPDMEHQLRENDVTPASAYRAEAIGEAQPFRPGLPREYDAWDLANKIMVDGWSAVGYPEILACRTSKTTTISWPQTTALRSVRTEVLGRFGSSITRATLNLIDDYVPMPLAANETYRMDENRFLGYLVTALFHPQRASRAVLRRSRAVFSAKIGLRSKGLMQ
jgi:glycogen synthase